MGIKRGWILVALESPNKSLLLTLLATCFLLPVLILSVSFSNREFLYLQWRYFKGPPLKCIHWLSSRWFKTCITHAYIFIHTHSFSFGKNFSFPLILHKIHRVQLSHESWLLGNFLPLKRLHHTFFQPFIAPSCTEYFLPALSGKLRLLKCDANTSAFFSWYNIFVPRGVLVWLQDLAG